jgi:uncharacterized radical SAM superfamily Fe-S cluster-containing enzyme
MPELKKAINQKGYTNVIVTDNVQSHAKDPFFVKKLEDAKKALSKIILPDTSKK